MGDERRDETLPRLVQNVVKGIGGRSWSGAHRRITAFRCTPECYGNGRPGAAGLVAELLRRGDVSVCSGRSVSQRYWHSGQKEQRDLTRTYVTNALDDLHRGHST